MIFLASRSASTISYNQASKYLADALATLRAKSATALALITFIENAPAVQIGIVAAQEPGAFGPFNMEWAFTGPCIIWSPTKKFKCKAADISGYRPNGSAVWAKKFDTVYPPEITLIHELGHAKQYIEDTSIFASKTVDGLVTEGSKSIDDIEADNLKRHENPVCKEMGLYQRVKYSDFDGFVDV